MEQFQSLLQDLQNILAKFAQKNEEARKRGETFNIFNVLGLSTNETRTHSAFLAELLNPKGSHGCGDAFLKEFLRLSCFKNFVFDTNNVCIKTEHSIGNKNEDSSKGGRIDIIIETKENIIIIENKIHGCDQDKQILRYSNYAKERKQEGHIKIIYLTLNGHEASVYSTQNKVEYTCVSYEKDILKWLTECSRIAVQKPLVRETIIQYTNLIKQLTSQDMEEVDKEAMFEIMAKYPHAVEQIFKVGNNNMDYIKYIYEHYVREKFCQFAKDHALNFNDDYLFNDNAEKGIFFYKKEWKTSAIYIWTEAKLNYNGFFCGISHYNDSESFKQKCPISDKLSYLLPEIRSNDWPLGFMKLNKFSNLDFSITPYMINDEYNEYIQKLILRILDEVERCKIILP